MIVLTQFMIAGIMGLRVSIPIPRFPSSINVMLIFPRKTIYRLEITQ